MAAQNKTIPPHSFLSVNIYFQPILSYFYYHFNPHSASDTVVSSGYHQTTLTQHKILVSYRMKSLFPKSFLTCCKLTHKLLYHTYFQMFIFHQRLQRNQPRMVHCPKNYYSFPEKLHTWPSEALGINFLPKQVICWTFPQKHGGRSGFCSHPLTSKQKR